MSTGCYLGLSIKTRFIEEEWALTLNVVSHVDVSEYTIHDEEEVKVNVKFSLEQALKAQKGNRGIVLLFL